MKNNGLMVLLVIFVGLACGVLLIIGINGTVQMGMSPVNHRLEAIESTQRIMLLKIDSIAKELKSLKDGVGGGTPRPQMPPPEDFNKVHTIDIKHSPILGNPQAPITIVEFSDFQCPFCARFHPAVTAAVKAYPDKVKAIIKNFPLGFHPKAMPAAKLAFAAHEQGKYHEMVDLLMENGAETSEDKVKEYAKALNLNYDKLMQDLKDNDAKYGQYIADDTKLGEQVEVQGTPTFFLNGKKTGARDLNGYKAEIDKILAGQ